MDQIFITDISIEKVRHLKNIEIPVTDTTLRHLILTGKNGSGKTSLLDALAAYLNVIISTDEPFASEKQYRMEEFYALVNENSPQTEQQKHDREKSMASLKKVVEAAKGGIDFKASVSPESFRERFEAGEMVVAYYQADRSFEATPTTTAEKVELKATYLPTESPRKDIVKYLLDMKVTQALAASAGKTEKVQTIQNWFDSFETTLQDIFENPELKLVFDEDTFLFHIEEPGKEPYDFNSFSSGYAAVMDIVIDLMLRMESHKKKSFLYDLPGIVLIDEIETHLHLEMQKNIMRLLTTIFPSIQFIVTTHSPFVINSAENATIFDIENRQLVKEGLTDVPYSGIVEGYFQTSELSKELETKFQRYKVLVGKPTLTDDDFAEIAELELYLDEIPDYLALKLSTEYKRLKLEFDNRENL